MTDHGEAHLARFERLRLFELFLGRPPPPLLMHIGPVRRVHQADHRVVDMRIEIHRFDNDRLSADHAGQHRRFVIRFGGAADIGGDIDPDDALLLAHGIAAHAEPGNIQGLVAGQRRHVGAGAHGIKRPAMIAALHHARRALAQHFAGRQRRRAVRADVAQAIDLAVEVAAQQHRLAQDDVALQGAGLQIVRQGREPPAVAQKPLAERDTGGDRG